jgi:oligopeptide/dipeptide ABC transporter ATP-binding protein
VSDPVLRVDGLGVGFQGDDGLVPVVEDLGFELHRGRTLALVGESGCGKSVTALTILGLLPPFARVTAGTVSLDGNDLAGLGDAALTRIRGERIAMIFQEPMSALNPVFTVGSQIAEMLRLHRGLDRRAAHERAVAALETVGIPDPAARARDYPHQLSGGMRQRVMIAMALACDPDVLIADEPTTALDVTIQAQIIDLMLDLQERLGTAILFISHDFGVVSHMADEIAVMYAGRIVEQGDAATIIDEARHPYTRALLNTTPHVGRSLDVLPAIAGRVPAPDERTGGCAFAPRCEFACEPCRAERPALVEVGRGHLAACHEIVARV